MSEPLVQQLRHLGARNSLSGSSLAAREAMAEAAELIENLSEVRSASDVEKGWRLFWGGFSRHLDLTHKQRTYTWHELMDACSAGMRAAGVVYADQSVTDTVKK